MTNTEKTMHGADFNEVRRAAQGIRQRVLAHCVRNNGGYLSQACSSAEILATLYLKAMKLGPSISPPVPPPFPGVPGTPGIPYVNGAGYNGSPAPDRDRFFLSPAHYALALYAALIEAGRMDPRGLEQFNQDGSSVEMIGAEHSPGFEAMGGALAQTLSQAAGLAWTRAREGDTGRVFVFLSDGEFQEGQTWEAIQTMVFFKVGNLIAYVDVNGFQCDGPTRNVMDLGRLEDKIRAFGAEVVSVDAHDPEALFRASLAEDSMSGPRCAPRFVLCTSKPSQGIPLLEERRPKFHYLRFVSETEKAAYAALLDSAALVEGGKLWKS
jgi:transketolase